jgi:ABC-type enterochelin transport system permease subunit
MKIRAELKESLLIAQVVEFLFAIFSIMKTAIQGGHTVLSRVIELHNPFSIAFVFVGGVAILDMVIWQLEQSLPICL